MPRRIGRWGIGPARWHAGLHGARALLGEKPTVASDIFALGVVLCEMLGPRKVEDTLAYFSQNDSPVTQTFTPSEPFDRRASPAQVVFRSFGLGAGTDKVSRT